MKKVEDLVKAVKAKERAEATAAGSPDKEKTPEELVEEIIEPRKAREASKAKTAEEETANGLEIFTTKPIKEQVEAVLIACPFCEEQRNIKGIKRHIELTHNVPGFSVQDLDDVEKGVKSLEDLVDEKLNGKGEATITNISDDILKKKLPSWGNVAPEEAAGQEPIQEEAILDPDDEKKIEEEVEEKGASGLISSIVIIGGIALIFLSRDPRFKEIATKLADSLKGLGKALGSKKSSSSKSFGQHAKEMNRKRGIR